MYVHPFDLQRHLKNDTNMDSVIPPFWKKNRHRIFWDFQDSSQIGLPNISWKFQLVFSKCPQILICLYYNVRQTAAWVKCRSIALFWSRDNSIIRIPSGWCPISDVVQKLSPGTAKTFLDYHAVHVFCHICTGKAKLALALFAKVRHTK